MKSATRSSKYKQFVKDKLTPERWEHTRGVMDLAGKLADTYDIHRERLLTSALLHDNARDINESDQKELAINFQGELDRIEEKSPGLWHAPAGAQRIVNQFEFNRDDPIVWTVANHSTGHPELGKLLKGLLVADFAEPSRTHSSAATIRNLIGNEPLDSLVREVMEGKVKWLMKTKRLIHPKSITTYNSLCD